MSENTERPGERDEGRGGASKRRSIAIAFLLFALVAMFYAATIIRFGGNIARQGM